MAFIVGEPVELTNTFLVNDTPTDPTTVSLAITTPAGVTTTYSHAAAEITKISTGSYKKTITVTSAGIWAYVWTGTGTAADIADGTFEVEDAIAGRRMYATALEAKALLPTSFAGLSDDAVHLWLEMASRVIDDYTHTRFNVTTPTTHTVTAPLSSLVILPYPFSAITAVTANGVTQTLITHYSLDDYGIRFTYRPRGPIVVTGIFGYPDVPAPVRLATVYIADSLISQSQHRPSIGVDAEGNASSLPTAAFVPRFASNGVESTGTVRADRLLAPYRVLEGVA